MEVKNPEDYDRVRADEPRQLGARRSCGSPPTRRSTSPARCCASSATTSCVYKPWEMGEQFLATEKDGSPKQWDPADIGRILNRYVFNSENPGIDAQRRA